MTPIEVPDCRLCAACCFSPSERYVELSGRDHARLLPEERERLVVFHGTHCYMRMEDGHCAALVALGAPGEARLWSCSVYERRPALCRALERGGPACQHELLSGGPRRPGAPTTRLAADDGVGTDGRRHS